MSIKEAGAGTQHQQRRPFPAAPCLDSHTPALDLPMCREILAMVALILVTAGCARADTFVRDDIITDPDPSHYSLCYDHGCNTVATLSLSPQEWLRISRLFFPKAATPALERKRIAKAIALFETFSGERTGTSNDKGGDLKGLGQPGQMDCIDESTNTTSYLRILYKEGLLRWHTVEDRSTRGWFIFGWPHTTAVVRDTQSGESYAVDSWFLDNGQPPFIVPLKEWKDGWHPPGDQ
jgi:hypothetical protein